VVGFNVSRLLHVLPLGIKMLLKGKVPNPLNGPIPGIQYIRSIFAARRRARSSS
jgi:hypothetical protein